MAINAAFEFLASHELISVSTSSLDGVPHAAPAFFEIDGRDIVLTTSPSTTTGKNFAANPRAAVAVGDAPDPGQTWNDAKGLQIEAEVVELSGDAATAAADKLRAKYAHLGGSHLQSHFYALKSTKVDYIHGADDGDEEFEPLGVNWTREQF